MPDILDRYNKFIKGMFPFNHLFSFEEKQNNAWIMVVYMLNRTQSMFRWDGLPDTIPQRMIELYLQVNGNVGFYRVDGDLYAFRGGLGGEPDAYYMPTIFTIANPALNVNVNARIGEDCTVVPNDSMYLGLMPLFNKYASAMAENELSIQVAMINSRVIDLVSAQDDRTRKSAEKFFSDIRDGKLGVISSNEFLEGIKAQPYGSTANSNVITNLIELEQYLKASWYNEIGLNANYNMKRESINSGESQLNNDALLPLVDDMLRCRQEGAERINEMFGTEITVDLASSWEDNVEEIDLEHEEMGRDLKDPEPENEPEEGKEDGNKED